jgi:Spy/CpxP family protein refolding chaperone
MKRSRFIFILTFALAMSAGAVLGALWNQLPVTPEKPQVNPGERHGGPDWLADQLHLRPEQKSQMDAIWGDMHKQMRANFDARGALMKERDETCRALLSDEQRTAWDKIRADYKTRMDALNPDRDKLVRKAESDTRAMLDEDQQKRWDELLKQMHERHHSPGGPGSSGGPPTGFHGNRGMRSGTKPFSSSSTTQPSGPGKGQVLQNTDQPRP